MDGSEQEIDIVKIRKVCGICEYRNDFYGICQKRGGTISYNFDTVFEDNKPCEYFGLRRCLIPE